VKDEQNKEKELSDTDLIEYLARKVMGWDSSVDWSNWEPLDELDHAWMMADKLRECTAHEFPLFLSLADDGGFYYRATVNHQHDHMLIASDVDKDSPCRAICKAVYAAMQKLEGDNTNGHE